jgi:hypothetical protein
MTINISIKLVGVLAFAGLAFFLSYPLKKRETMMGNNLLACYIHSTVVVFIGENGKRRLTSLVLSRLGMPFEAPICPLAIHHFLFFL